MKKIEIKSYQSILSLIYAILILVLGVLLVTYPEESQAFISYVFGGLLIILAVIKFTWVYFSKKYQEKSGKWDIVVAIICLLIGLACILFYDYIEQGIRITIGMIIIFIGINRLINGFKVFKTKMFIPLLIISLLMIGTGIFTICYQYLEIIGLGIILIGYGAIDIIGYICYQFVKPEVKTVSVAEADYEIVKKKIKTHKCEFFYLQV